MNIQIQEVASHRNGCFGAPFHVVRFTCEGELLLGFVFGAAEHVAVIDPAKALETVAFAENSWRGDYYEDALRAAIASYEKARAAPVSNVIPLPSRSGGRAIRSKEMSR